MNYDFDIYPVTPQDIQTRYAHLLMRFGMADQAKQHIAMFRDPETSRALANASWPVRECFTSAGFALNSHDGGAGNHQYVESDKDARARILAQLQENVEGLPGDVRWNGFDIGDFFVAAYGAMPAPRKRLTFADTSRAVLPPITLLPSDRIVSRITSRALSTPAPGL